MILRRKRLEFEKAVIITSIIYIFFLCYIFFKIKNLKKREIIFILLLSIVTPYNLLISRIANYQLITPFTFIYRYRVGFFSLLDTIFIIIILYNLKNIIKLKMKGIIKVLFIRDVLYIFCGTVMLIVSKGYIIDNGRTYLAYLRGFFFEWGSYFLFLYFFQKNKNYKIDNLIKILLQVIIGSYFISLLYKSNEVWIRFGKKITILSQEWATFFIIFICIYIFLLNKKIRKKRNIIILVILVYFIYINSYKGNLIYFAIFLIYLSLEFGKSQINKILKIYFFGLVACLIAIFFIFKFKDNGAINTRKLQLSQYIQHLKEQKKEEIIYLFGSGIGSSYKGSMGDYGESYEIDRRRYGEYKFSLQTPGLSNFKDVGIVGIILCLVINSIVLIKIFKQNKKNIKLEKNERVEFSTIRFFLFYNLVTLVIIVSIPSVALFTGYLYARYDNLLGN